MSMDEYGIVVSVDGSVDSHAALAWALGHAAAHPSAHLTLVHDWFVPTAAGMVGAASIVLGSVGSEVLKRAPCPVVTVPPERAERAAPPVDREAATVSTGATR